MVMVWLEGGQGEARGAYDPPPPSPPNTPNRPTWTPPPPRAIDPPGAPPPKPLLDPPHRPSLNRPSNPPPPGLRPTVSWGGELASRTEGLPPPPPASGVGEGQKQHLLSKKCLPPPRFPLP